MARRKTSVRLEGGLQLDLRVVREESFGAAWLYFTGSKEHNVALRHDRRRVRAVSERVRLFEGGGARKDPERGTRSRARTRRRCTRPSVWTGSRRSCARTAARSPPPPEHRLPGALIVEDRSAATCTCTGPGRTARARGRDARGVRPARLRLHGADRSQPGAAHDGRPRRRQARAPVGGVGRGARGPRERDRPAAGSRGRHPRRRAPRPGRGVARAPRHRHRQRALAASTSTSRADRARGEARCRIHR